MNQQETLYGYLYNDESKKFESQVRIDADPLESIKQGKFVPLMPANCTLIAPPAEQDGFDRVWNGSAWEYKEKPKEKEPEPYVPTELDKAREELWQTESKLASMDYIGTKIATGRATKEEYAEQIAEMNVLAAKVDECRARVKALEEAEAAKQQETTDDAA